MKRPKNLNTQIGARHLYKEIGWLSDEDQQALVVLIDSLVKRSEFHRMMAG